MEHLKTFLERIHLWKISHQQEPNREVHQAGGEFGLSLEEIKGLLATGGAAECRKGRDLLQRKLRELDDRLKAIKSFRCVLARHLSECEAELNQQVESACCPVVAVGKQTKG